MIDGYVKQANGKLERWETIKRFAILPQRAERRRGRSHPEHEGQARAVEKKYADVLDGLYDKD